MAASRSEASWDCLRSVTSSSRAEKPSGVENTRVLNHRPTGRWKASSSAGSLAADARRSRVSVSVPATPGNRSQSVVPTIDAAGCRSSSAARQFM